MDRFNVKNLDQRLIKYFVMASIIVALEIIVFQLLYLLSGDYILATILSFAIAVILNWVGGRVFIFKPTNKNRLNEFFAVLAASIIGVAIQTVVVVIAVQLLSLYPLIGKILSVAFSFFWNYFFRAKFIYK